VDNYSVKTRAGEPVAGRATDVVELEPVAADRPSVRIWVDREKRFPVKLERRAVGGEWTVSFETSSVEFPAIEPIVAAAAVEPVKPVVTAEWLPSGFVHVRTTGTKGTESRYSDGVASLKIITGRQPWWQKHEKKAPEGALAVARHKMGPYAEYGLRLDEELYVTVLGSLSDEVMTRVVGALKRAP
jgi:negative regulator of sigma E activity